MSSDQVYGMSSDQVFGMSSDQVFGMAHGTQCPQPMSLGPRSPWHGIAILAQGLGFDPGLSPVRSLGVALAPAFLKRWLEVLCFPFIRPGPRDPGRLGQGRGLIGSKY